MTRFESTLYINKAIMYQKYYHIQNKTLIAFVINKEEQNIWERKKHNTQKVL